VPLNRDKKEKFLDLSPIIWGEGTINCYTSRCYTPQDYTRGVLLLIGDLEKFVSVQLGKKTRIASGKESEIQ
jgi:hypothetical protein